jgi:hypothetical protein
VLVHFNKLLRVMNLGIKIKSSIERILHFLFSSDTLRDILSLLRNTNHPQGRKKEHVHYYYRKNNVFLFLFAGDQMIKIMRSWAKTNNIPV